MNMNFMLVINIKILMYDNIYYNIIYYRLWYSTKFYYYNNKGE